MGAVASNYHSDNALDSIIDLKKIIASSVEVEGFKDFKAKAIKSLALSSFPDETNELWRYTNPSLFNWDQIAGSGLIEVIKINGGGGVELHPLNKAFEHAQCSKVFTEWNEDLKLDPISLLHMVTFGGGAFITVPPNTEIKEPIEINTLRKGDTGSNVSWNVVYVGKNSSVTFIDNSFEDKNTEASFSRLDVVADANSSVTWVSVQELSDTSQYLSRQRFHQLRDSRVQTISASLGAKVSRVDSDYRLLESGANANMAIAYLADGNRHLDFHPTQFHMAPNCHSNLYCKGALKDYGRSVYYGYIRVSPDAQKTDAYQTNRNLMLSDNARADTIPNLEIQANDVKCSHGASVSRVGDDELFYLMSRGLKRKDAEQLLVEGFFADLLGRIDNSAIRDLVLPKILNRLYKA